MLHRIQLISSVRIYSRSGELTCDRRLWEAFDHFTRVYDCVDASFEEMRKTASERLRRPGTSIRWHFVLANLVVFVPGFLIPVRVPWWHWWISYADQVSI